MRRPERAGGIVHRGSPVLERYEHSGAARRMNQCWQSSADGSGKPFGKSGQGAIAAWFGFRSVQQGWIAPFLMNNSCRL